MSTMGSLSCYSAAYPHHRHARKLPFLQVPARPAYEFSICGSLTAWSPKIKLPENVKSITSTSNPFVKHCIKLRQSPSYRQAHGSALVVGTICIREIYNFNMSNQDQSSMVDCLFLLDGSDIPEELNDRAVHIIHANSLVMKRLSGLQSAESVEAIAVMRIPRSFLNLDNLLSDTDVRAWLPSPHRILVLDGIQDPGNLGTLLRSAMAFRWDGVFLLPGCCDPFNEKAVRASRGASFQLHIVSGGWTHLNSLSNEFKVKMLAGHPDTSNKSKHASVLSHDLVDSLADKHVFLLLGSEGIGLSEKSIKSCELVSIPMAEGFESLNVAVAGGIFMFMLQHQE
ncbi:hypothetical protein Droror1_Dr00005252 [Drosera rotundifolia]